MGRQWVYGRRAAVGVCMLLVNGCCQYVNIVIDDTLLLKSSVCCTTLINEIIRAYRWSCYGLSA